MRLTVRAGSAFRAYLSLGPLLASPLACSFAIADLEPCENDESCQQSFGLGSVCLDSGFCAEPTLPQRCSRSFPEDFVDAPERYTDRIVVGSLYSYTEHEDSLLASELAVRLVDEQAALDDRRFAILHCDYSPQAGDDLDDLAAVETLVPFLVDRVGVSAIVGPRGSTRTEAAFRATPAGSTVIISPSATSPSLTALEGAPSDDAPGYLWRTVPPDSLQSEVIANDVAARGRLAAAIIYEEGSYGNGLSALFASSFSERGGTVAWFPFEPNSDISVRIATVGEGIAAGQFDQVLFISSEISDYVDFFAGVSGSADLEDQYVALGAGGEGGLFLTDTAFNDRLLQALPGTAPDLMPIIRGTRPAPARGVVYNAFAAAFSMNFDMDATPFAFAPHSYDAAWLALYCSAWSVLQEGDVTPLGCARGLRRVSGGTAFDIRPDNWSEILAEFREGRSVDVRGASGLLDYDLSVEETASPIEIWHVVPDERRESAYVFEALEVVEPR